ncbi:hypothetical protein LVD17_12490 [Fulvivirga ulvae]|uniref:hypothetical protein n=1 Tax=Fulvivirga ulvae TaxID=2904245 RepID=UPI001F21EA41|nr:hypothetical protein [Fulvivirga ulvae]UII34626.1 hypothetical protein LVD17_12490 [Fulvivirga ulvae]
MDIISLKLVTRTVQLTCSKPLVGDQAQPFLDVRRSSQEVQKIGVDKKVELLVDKKVDNYNAGFYFHVLLMITYLPLSKHLASWVDNATYFF